MNSSKQNRIKPLQSLRFIFILGIIFSHFGMRFSYAYFGVSGFFVLSGFVLTLKYYNNAATELANPFIFTVNRIKSIYFTYILTILMLFPMSLYNIIRHRLSLKGYIKTFFVDVLLLQSWFPHIKLVASINDVSWFLSTILFLYLIFPFIFRLLKKIPKSSFLIGLFVLSSAISLIMLFAIKKIFFIPDNLFNLWLIYRFPIFRINDFLAGCIAAIFYEKHLKNIKINVYVGTFMEACALIVIPITTYINKQYCLKPEYYFLSNPVSLFILPATFTVLTFAMAKGFISQIFSLDFIVRCGDYSSGVFLIHYVFIYYIYFLKLERYLYGFSISAIITKMLVVVCSFGISAITMTLFRRISSSKKTPSHQIQSMS